MNLGEEGIAQIINRITPQIKADSPLATISFRLYRQTGKTRLCEKVVSCNHKALNRYWLTNFAYCPG
jgi:hypothetical protein